MNITTREYLAGLAMQALIIKGDKEAIVDGEAVRYANEVMEALDKDAEDDWPDKQHKKLSDL